jgi:hypothetical protein
LTEKYGIETKVLNQAVKRNIGRFPENFLFQLTADEFEPLRSQIVTIKPGRGQHRKYQPYVFTEQGVAMLSAILKSETAVKICIRIMEAFVEMRRLVVQNAVLFHRLDSIERRQLETDQKFEQVFKAIESKNPEPDYGIFFEGQIFYAYVFISDLFKKANQSIILIDNYVDESTLTHLTKHKRNVSVTIYTQSLTKSFILDLKKHNEQYPKIEVKSINWLFLLFKQSQILFKNKNSVTAKTCLLFEDSFFYKFINERISSLFADIKFIHHV